MGRSKNFCADVNGQEQHQNKEFNTTFTYFLLIWLNNDLLKQFKYCYTLSRIGSTKFDKIQQIVQIWFIVPNMLIGISLENI